MRRRLVLRLLFESGNLIQAMQGNETEDEFREHVEKIGAKITKQCPDEMPPLIEWDYLWV